MVRRRAPLCAAALAWAPRMRQRRRHWLLLLQQLALALRLGTGPPAALLQLRRPAGGRPGAAQRRPARAPRRATEAPAPPAAAAEAAEETESEGGGGSKRGRRSRRRQRAAAALLAGLVLPRGVAASLQAAHEPAAARELEWAALPPAAEPGAAALALRRARPRDAARFGRKRRQVEAFAAVVEAFLEARGRGVGATVVDFGCSSGNLLLPLAATFPEADFVGVDMKPETSALLEARVKTAGLRNVRCWCGPIQEYNTTGLGLDLALGLHVCGEATDRIIIEAVSRGAPFALSPCCIGSINKRADEAGFFAEIPMEEGEVFSVRKLDDGSAVVLIRGEQVPLYGAHKAGISERTAALLSFWEKKQAHGEVHSGYFAKRLPECAGVPVLEFLLGNGTAATADFTARSDIVLIRRSEAQLAYPRSTWLSSQISTVAFAELASLADTGHREQGLGEDVFYSAKTLVTLDRGMWAKERGYNIALHRILGLGDYVKDDLLLGSPGTRELPSP